MNIQRWCRSHEVPLNPISQINSHSNFVFSTNTNHISITKSPKVRKISLNIHDMYMYMYIHIYIYIYIHITLISLMIRRSPESSKFSGGAWPTTNFQSALDCLSPVAIRCPCCSGFKRNTWGVLKWGYRNHPKLD